VKRWLAHQATKPAHFVELFAGGAIVGLTVAGEGLAEHVTLLELDGDVAAVWQTIWGDDDGAEWLAHRILSFDLTHEHVSAVLASHPDTIRERAFQTIVRNRTLRGGILAHGSGLLKFGENGKGIASRWYPDTLARRIRGLAPLRDRITFLEGDALTYLAAHLNEPATTFFADPPYTAPGKRAGKRLYRFYEVDHERLFDLCQSAAGDFMLTYDDAESVQDMAKRRGFAVTPVLMKNTHHAEMYELLITRA
jgi:DNA adenine methylase